MLRRQRVRINVSSSSIPVSSGSSSLALFNNSRRNYATGNISQIADIRFDRGSALPVLDGTPDSESSTITNGNKTTPIASRPKMSPTEVAYQRFAKNHGMCSVQDFYRGVGQAYYALATSLGPNGTSDTRPPPIVLMKEMAKEKNPPKRVEDTTTTSASAPQAETTTTNKAMTTEESSKEKKPQDEQQTSSSPAAVDSSSSTVEKKSTSSAATTTAAADGKDSTPSSDQNNKAPTTSRLDEADSGMSAETKALNEKITAMQRAKKAGKTTSVDNKSSNSSNNNSSGENIDYTSPSYKTNPYIIDRLKLTKKEDILFTYNEEEDLKLIKQMKEDAAEKKEAEEKNEKDAEKDTDDKNKKNISSSNKNNNIPENNAPTRENYGLEWPEKFGKDTIERFERVEKDVPDTSSQSSKKKSSDSTTEKKTSNNNNNKNNTGLLSNGLLGLYAFRALFAPSLRDALYKAAPWGHSSSNVVPAGGVSFSGGAGTTSMFETHNSRESIQRFYHLLANPDEKIEAVQMFSFELLAREGSNAMNAAKNNNSNSNKKDTIADLKRNSGDVKEEDVRAVLEKMQSHLDSDSSSSSLSSTSEQEKMDDLARNFEVSVTVNLLIQVPPARYCHNYAYFRERIRTEGLEEHFDGSADTASNAADSSARVLAISNVYGTFKVLEWLSKKLSRNNSKNKNDGSSDSSSTNNIKPIIDPRAMPHHIMGLSEAFPTQPCRYVKSMTMVYNYELKHWRVLNVQLNGHYMRDFDLEHWKENGGGTVYDD